MKKTMILLLLATTGLTANAQESKSPALMHEVGTDLYPLLKSIFQQYSFSSGTPVVPSMVYRLHIRQKMAFRFRADLDNNRQAGYSSTYTNGNTTSVYTVNPGWSRTWNTRVGWQFHMKAGKVMAYSGVDILLGRQSSSYGSSSNQTTRSGNYEYITLSENSNISRTTTVGAAVFLGVATKLSKHIGISYEMSFEQTMAAISGETKNGYTYITKHNGTVQSTNTSGGKQLMDTNQSSVRLFPLSLLMLSYRF